MGRSCTSMNLWSAVAAIMLILCAPRVVRPDEHRFGPTRIYKTWQGFTTADGLPDDNILAIHVEGDEVWLGTEGGLARYQGDEWRAWTREDGLPWPAISAIDIHPRNRDVWLGSWGGGLIRLSGGRFDHFDQLNSGLAGNLVFAVAVVDDQVWVATNGGLSVLDTNTNRWDIHFERRADTTETAITSLSATDRFIYAAISCGGVMRFDRLSGGWTNVVAPWHKVEGEDRRAPDTTLEVAAHERSLWWVTQDAVAHRLVNNRWVVRQLDDLGQSDRFINCLASRGNREAWLGTQRGLITLVDGTDSFSVDYHPIDQGNTWEATIRQDGAILGREPIFPGPPGDRVRCIAFQGDDIWVGTSAGLAHGTRHGKNLVQLETENESSGTKGPRSAPVIPRLKPETKTPESIPIAVLRPDDRTISLEGEQRSRKARFGQQDRLAVALAIDEANARGGFRGKTPFQLVTGPQGAFDGWGWTTPEDDFVSAANQLNAWGIVGYLGRDHRLATTVATRTEVPIVNFSKARMSVDERISPWIFRCQGNEPRRHRMLLDHLFDRLGFTRVAAVAGRTEDQQLNWWRDYARTRGFPLVAEMAIGPNGDISASGWKALEGCDAEVVLTWCDASLSAGILRHMRKSGMNQLFVGSEEILDDAFIKLAGTEPGSVLTVARPMTDESRPPSRYFIEAYTKRYGRVPPANAFPAFEGTNHLLQAIESAGLKRDAIRKRLAEMGCTATGERHSEAHRDGTSEFTPLRLLEGRWVRDDR